jgi:type I restriction enzyme R subunit
LEKWQLLHTQQQDTQTAIADLLAMLDTLPRHSINVRPHWDELDTLARQWPELSESALDHLSRLSRH